MTTKVVRLALAILLVAMVALAATSRDGAVDAQDRPNIAKALNDGGLKEAARVSGGHYQRLMEFNPHYMLFSSVHGLVKSASNIVIADVVENRCHLNGRGQYVTTDYKAWVRQELMGSVGDNKEIVVSILGGRVEFGDGLSASVETPDFRRPLNGDKVLLFLQPISPDDPNMAKEVFTYAGEARVFRLAANARGVFGLALQEEEKIKVNSTERDGLARDARKKDIKTFLQDVRQAIKDVEKDRELKKNASNGK